MKEIIVRLWKDPVFLLTSLATGGGAWEVAGGAPTWVNIVTAATAALAAGWSAAPKVTEVMRTRNGA